MKRVTQTATLVLLAIASLACSKTAPPPPASATPAATTASGSATAKPPAGQVPIAAASSLRIFVTNESSGDLSIIDGETNQVVGTLPLGKRPRGLHITPDKKSLLVALSGSPVAGPGVDESTLPPPDRRADGIGIVDLTTNTFVKLLGAGSDPEEFAINLDGSMIYVANEDAGICSVVEIPSGRIVKSLPVGDEPEGVGLSPQGKFVYVTSENNRTVTAIDTSNNTVIATFRVGRRPRVAAFLPDGSRGYVSSENDGTVSVVDTANML